MLHRATMGLRTQKAVMVNLDKLSGGHMDRAAKRYRRETLQPLVEGLRTAGSGQEALRHLNGKLLERMDAGALETAVTDDYVQSAMIGRASALPPPRH